ncbi:M14 family zinc carboxypeptidase [Aliiglaciecola sp. 2_MG-2023]|uniref:M14 family zinc carboxypeptidase n=1 Tax=unclassified Aliiglaciecola TaxID=2593648 RepID=UPI0026E24299|nr:MULTISPECIES: M14 family zinc carboxypeptidase [unclassified Aliiglaciecola]MDO6710427.1 M14 family zinc carboxypeptidase [Aliiglaciecola sp. 2_MG-2023]MDO6751708.1 M14 family zinc carboxypeptidase [Aliiglaciecola sp. 1_MG-2023]
MFPENNVLEQLYSSARIAQLDKPHVFPQDLLEYLADPFFADTDFMSKQVVGHSYLGQPIQKVTVGKGNIAILFWSQMHGDEPTATAALLDLIQFFQQNKTRPWLNEILDKVTLHIVPMLNPDGAQQQTRENAQGIDINRDAAALQTPEGKVLKSLFDNIKPLFAFNLHDQSKYYRIEDTLKPVEMAFLAPAGDAQESIPEHRCNAMKLIAAMLSDMSDELFAKVAKYQDSYSPRAFGDLACSQGIACVLIESGATFNDSNRQNARRLNFLCLLHSIHHIAEQSYNKVLEFDYNSLPFNIENGLSDLIIRGLNVDTVNASFSVDVAIKQQHQKLALISELGDLQQLGAYEVLNAHNFSYAPGNTFEVNQPIDLNKDKYISLLRNGFCRFSGDISLINQLTDWPIIKVPGESEPAGFWRKNMPPTWLMLFNDQVKAALLEGKLIVLE